MESNHINKKNSKFFAILLTTVLVFSQLGYAADPVSNFDDFHSKVEDSLVTEIYIDNDINATTTGGSLGEQQSGNLTINGNSCTVNGNGNEGMKVYDKTSFLQNITISSFSSSGSGGVINSSGTKLTVENSSFTSNSSTYGGVIYQKGGAATIDNAYFGNNSVAADDESGYGGVIYITGTGSNTNITNSVFEENSSDFAGVLGIGTGGGSVEIASSTFKYNNAKEMGALGIFKDATLENNTFIENYTTYTSTANDNMGAGAIGIGSKGTVSIDSNTFIGNESVTDGGAINTRKNVGNSDQLNDNSAAKLDITNSTFTNNKATKDGGAVNNYFYNSYSKNGYVYIASSTFESNKAKDGGAIYNHGEKDLKENCGKMFIENSTFTANTATGKGGAIYNEGIMKIENSQFSSNESSQGGAILVAKDTGDLKVKNSTFIANKSTTGFSGAIHVSGKAVIEDTLFDRNEAKYGGALTSGKGSDLIGSDLTLSSVTFTNNEAEEMGALGIYKKAELTNVTFIGNKSTSTDDSDKELMGAGAIGLGAEATVSIISGTFENNKSQTAGGAIGTRKKEVANNSKAKLDIKDSIFIGNSAELRGGAIDNYFFNSEGKPEYVYVASSTFKENTAKDGGAIYNHDVDIAENTVKMLIENSTFTKNTASGQGGAIYNEGEMIISNSQFSGNTASGDKNDVYNIGNLQFSSGITTMEGGIVGVGSTTVNGGALLELGEDAKLEQYKLEILANSSLTANAGKVKITTGIANVGVLTYTGGTNKNEINGLGQLIIDGVVNNYIGTTISQSSITVNNGKSFTANASDITTEEGIANKGTLTFNDGTNNNQITGTGFLVIDGDVTNSSGTTISQSSITINNSFTANARDITTEEGITNEGILKFNDDADARLNSNITGAGSIIKEGVGTVSLNGANNYKGTTTITGGAISISSKTNISTNTIFMDGGKFIAENSDIITLSNEIMGTSHNDVNIEVKGNASLILKGEIFGNEDLVKTGAGILNLQMASNSYAGDTVVSSGTIKGTTKNINGMLKGTGASNLDTFEFYDETGEVVLNEVHTSSYIGTFNKTGSSTMTVVNNFRAQNANIVSGTFVINNDTAMGGSGKVFEVVSTMTVSNALLKGYGDITVGKLIISSGATFAPGNSTTTFKVHGNFEIEANGTYDVEFSQLNLDKANEGQTNDKTIVTGTGTGTGTGTATATIDKNSKLVLNNTLGKYYIPETFTIIEADSMNDFVGYIDGNIKFNDSDAQGLRKGYSTRISTRVYTEGKALKVDLQRERTEFGTTMEFSRSHNEQEVASAIDAISTGYGGDITKPLDVMDKMFYYESTYDINGLKAALNDITGVIHSNSTMLTFTNAKIEHVYDKIKERTKDLFPCTKLHDKVWAQYYYNTYNVDKDENSPKFDTSVNGFLVGLDMISVNNFTFGVMAGYGTSELKQLNDNTTMNDINLGLYSGYETDKWLFKGMLLGGYEQYKTDRNINFMNRMANSKYNGFNVALDLEAGYKIALNSSTSTHKLTLKPYIGITGNYINNEGFKEKGAESLNLKVEDYNNIALQARLGVGINGNIKKFGWYAKAGIRQFLTEDYNEIESSLLDFQDQTKMKIRSAKIDKLSYGGGIGADYALSDAWTVFANGLASFADKSNNYYGNIGLMYKFGCANNVVDVDKFIELSEKLDNKTIETEKLKRELDILKEKEEALTKEKIEDKEKKYRMVKTVRLATMLNFVFGTEELTKEGEESLGRIANELSFYPNAEIIVEGHADDIGSYEINQAISEVRANKVAKILKKDYDIKNTIAVVGKGQTVPISNNDSPNGRAQNRRVEIVLLMPEE